jgi:hypothetical protein
LTNAGRHYTCERGTLLSCEGKSLDNNLATTFKASVFRRP